MTEAIPLWPAGAPPAGVDPACDDRALLDAVPTLTPVVVGAAGERRAAVIVLPGGGYGRHAPHEAEPVAEWLGSLGLAAFVCRYRVWPNRHPAPLADAERAVRLVRARAEEWGVDAARVGVLGFSAGGHCAATVACLGQPGRPDHADPVERLNGRPDAAILCYAVLSLQPWSHTGSRDKLLGPAADPALVRQLSLENAVDAAHPPTFLWSTADDPAVSVFNSLHYAAALRLKGVPFAMSVYPHGRHGLGLAGEAPQVAAWTGACADWLRGLGWAR
jgi:acetyl esterase/lipase